MYFIVLRRNKEKVLDLSSHAKFPFIDCDLRSFQNSVKLRLYWLCRKNSDPLSSMDLAETAVANFVYYFRFHMFINSLKNDRVRICPKMIVSSDLFSL